ncbi:hypothetical protein [Bacillus sp. CDB3]|uniref:hypothetical protein n=1 Tax=Bacillus sp. CDB3 TaxID=360310 RepID=UPI0015C43041|nr:hypothetical protein [Bacillus sp. CDB3]
MKFVSYAISFGILGHCIGLLYTFFRWFGLIFAGSDRSISYSEEIYNTLPFILTAIGISTYALFKQNFKWLCIIGSISMLNAIFLIGDSIYLASNSTIFSDDELAGHIFNYVLTVSPLVYFIFIALSIMFLITSRKKTF